MRRGLVLRERESIAAVWKVVSSELAGKPLSAARRSIGSMLLLQFGRRTAVEGHNRIYYQGEWTLLVEGAYWKIEFADAPRLTDASEYALIDKTLPKLRKKTVRHIMFDRRERLIIKFEDNIRWVFSGTDELVRPVAWWELSRNGKGKNELWSLTYKWNRRLVLETGA